MLRGTYPGIYTREIPSGVRSIAGVPTAIAAFVGPTKTGIDGRPVRVLNFGDFERSHGGLASDSEMSYGVMHFFQNGGGEALVVRVARAGAVKAKSVSNNSTGAMLTTEALSSGISGNDIFIEIDAARSITGQNAVTARTFGLTLAHGATGVLETFPGLSTDAASLTFAKSVVNDPDLGSKLAAIDLTVGAEAPMPTGTTIRITADPAFFGTAERKATKQYSIKAGLFAINADGSLNPLLAKTDILLLDVGDAMPLTHLGLARLIEAQVNEKLSAKNVQIEGQVIDFGTPFGRSMRFRTKVVRFQTQKGGGVMQEHPAPDGIVTMEDGAQPGAGDKLFAEYKLDAALANASRYRLGKVYAATPNPLPNPLPDPLPWLVAASLSAAGADGSGPPGSTAMKSGVQALSGEVFFNLLCIPDAVRATANDPNAAFYADYADIYDAAATLCEAKRAFLLIDTPPNVKDVPGAQAWKTNGFNVRSDHAAAYFPRLRMSDPLNPGMLRAFPPSGAMAGIIARTDSNRGVWKAPAGIDAVVAGVFAPAVTMTDDEHGLLNPVGLNCFRKFPVYGSVAFGARTLAGADDEASEWKYIPVRRTALYILESLRRGLTWVTFEPNDEPLWGQVRMNVGAFMQGMFRQGAFQGRSPRDAYLVKCDAETTTQADINLGVVNVVVGFAPLKPAEFVFITLQQLAGQAQR